MRRSLLYNVVGSWLLSGFIGLNAAASNASPIELKPREGVRFVEEQASIMGTKVSILILGEEEAANRGAIDVGFAEMRRIESLMTDWRDSPFERINQNAGIAPVEVGDEIFFLIQESIRVSALTGGSFDITYASAGKLWDFKKTPPLVPDAKLVRESLRKIGYTKIQLDKKAKTVFLPHKGMRIGLGGIAKGYAVDRVVQKLKVMGMENFAVNMGGDLTVRGTKGGKLWWVEIRHPRNKTENIALLPISNGSVVTSGDSERYFIVDGVRYSHILNPKTGYPANKSQSVTLIAKHAYLADAFATGIFVLGPNEGMALIESQDHLEGMIVDARGEVHVSSGLQQKNDMRSGPNVL